MLFVPACGGTGRWPIAESGRDGVGLVRVMFKSSCEDVCSQNRAVGMCSPFPSLHYCNHQPPPKKQLAWYLIAACPKWWDSLMKVWFIRGVVICQADCLGVRGTRLGETGTRYILRYAVSAIPSPLMDWMRWSLVVVVASG